MRENDHSTMNISIAGIIQKEPYIMEGREHLNITIDEIYFTIVPKSENYNHFIEKLGQLILNKKARDEIF
jgi:hypothetical protein